MPVDGTIANFLIVRSVFDSYTLNVRNSILGDATRADLY